MKTDMYLCILAVAMAGLWVPSTPQAAETANVAARDTMRTERFEPLHQDDATGRLAYAAVNKSTLREATRTGLLNGLTKTCQLTADLTNGSGPMEGFCRHEGTDGALAIVQWNGMCDTGPGVDGKPQTRCWGGWRYLPGGKGRLAGVTGGGGWRGHVQPSGEFEEEVDGMVTKP